MELLTLWRLRVLLISSLAFCHKISMLSIHSQREIMSYRLQMKYWTGTWMATSYAATSRWGYWSDFTHFRALVEDFDQKYSSEKSIDWCIKNTWSQTAREQVKVMKNVFGWGISGKKNARNIYQVSWSRTTACMLTLFIASCLVLFCFVLSR